MFASIWIDVLMSPTMLALIGTMALIGLVIVSDWFGGMLLHTWIFWFTLLGAGAGFLMFVGTIFQLVNGPPYIEGCYPHWAWAVIGAAMFVGLGEAARRVARESVGE